MSRFAVSAPVPMRAALVLALLALSSCTDDTPTADADPAPEVLTEMQLLDRLPTAISGLRRGATTTETDGALGVQVVRASANYVGPDRDTFVGLNLMDLGSAEMAQNMGYGWGLTAAPDTLIGGHPARAEQSGGRRVVQILVGGRFLIEAASNGVPAAEVDAAAQSPDLAGLARIAARD